METPLPKYDRPPVVEVVLSVQFERLDLSVVRLGLAWQSFRERFPRIEEKPEIDPAFERFDSIEKTPHGVRFEVGAMPAPRLWCVDSAGTELVQVQRDRFIRNWRKVHDDNEYPSYSHLREKFLEDWMLFEQFVDKEFGQKPLYNQCEVTYVNIVEEFDTSSLQKVLSWAGGKFSDNFLAEPEEAELSLRFVQRNEAGDPWGRLHVSAAPVSRLRDDASVVRLSVTGRGAPESSDKAAALARLDTCHESVVRGFSSFTTPEMHSIWERKS